MLDTTRSIYAFGRILYARNSQVVFAWRNDARLEFSASNVANVRTGVYSIVNAHRVVGRTAASAFSIFYKYNYLLFTCHYAPLSCLK